jgi:biofilm PGA synthesis N-glycosyltransferase PgaC
VLHLAALILFAYVALYPVVTSAGWIAGGLLFRLLDERNEAEMPPGGWPGVSVLIPAYNEEQVIADCVRAALAVDYPELEVLVLDDGSSDGTVKRATEAGAGDPRLEVVRDPLNRGKADRLNLGFRRARHEYVVVTDADTHIQRLALKLLVSRMMRSPRIAAVAGSPHVTNRRSVLAALQILEVASIVGLIRRTQALIGRVGVVAGVLGLFRREAVLAVGGYDSRMATEDIDLSWRLLFAGWHTAFEPNALCGMEVPAKIRPLWAQRRRWACGQGEVLHTHGREAIRWRNRWVWPLAFEAMGSLLWVVGLGLAMIVATIELLTGGRPPLLEFSIAWGIAISVVALLQLSFALVVDHPHDLRAGFAFILGPLYPLGYWAISATAALRSEVPAAFKGPHEERVAWDIEREHENPQAVE